MIFLIKWLPSYLDACESCWEVLAPWKYRKTIRELKESLGILPPTHQAAHIIQSVIFLLISLASICLRALTPSVNILSEKCPSLQDDDREDFNTPNIIWNQRQHLLCQQMMVKIQLKAIWVHSQFQLIEQVSTNRSLFSPSNTQYFYCSPKCSD